MEIIEVGGRRFRVPIISEEKTLNKKIEKNAKKTFNETKWLEESEKIIECKIGASKVVQLENSDSDSGDDDILAYWLHGDVPTHKSDPVEKNRAEDEEIYDKPLELKPQKSSLSSKDLASMYSHVICIPLYDSPNIKKRIEAFRKKLVDATPIFDRYFNTQKLHLPILYLKPNVEELETLMQVMPAIKEYITLDKKKPKIEIQGLSFYCDDHSRDMKKAASLFTTIKKNEETKKMEQIIHEFISQIIEFAIVKEQDLQNCRMDLSESKYKVENWRINLLQSGVFDLTHVLTNSEFKDFVFGQFEFSGLSLCKTGKDIEEVASFKF